MARRTFFSFHYVPDVWRAWNVRNSWIVTSEKEDRGFFDASVFEAKKRESDDVLKKFLRDGLDRTSVTCVLAGTQTWSRRWVRYEIARSLVRGNGLLTLDIHGVANDKALTCARGPDPLSVMGVYLGNGQIYLAELVNDKWVQYSDYKLPIPAKDLWFDAPTTTTVVPLSKHCLRYDFAAMKGRQNLGGWIEVAAGMAGH